VIDESGLKLLQDGKGDREMVRALQASHEASEVLVLPLDAALRLGMQPARGLPDRGSTGWLLRVHVDLLPDV
jgi:hypothetical protein